MLDWPTAVAIASVMSPVLVAAWKYTPRNGHTKMAVLETEQSHLKEMLREDIEELKNMFADLKLDVHQELRELGRGQHELRDMVLQRIPPLQ